MTATAVLTNRKPRKRFGWLKRLAVAYFATVVVAAAVSTLRHDPTAPRTTPSPAHIAAVSATPNVAAPVSNAPAAADNTTSDASSDRDLTWAEAKVLAEDNLKHMLKDDQGVHYRGVSSHLVASEDGKRVKVFCGEMNSKTAFGGYGGWSQFIASPGAAYTDEQVPADGFGELWSHYCGQETSGPDIWQ